MLGKKRKTLIYLTALFGAAFMVLLRIFDAAGIGSVILVTIGITAWLYSVRHASTLKEYISIAGIMAFTFIVRCYGYTDVIAVDILLGIPTGFILFGLMNAGLLAVKFKDCFWVTLIFPVMYILFLYLTETVKINMPFRLDSYFSCIPVLCQITSVFGIYFIDFLLALTASVIVFFIDHRKCRQSIVLATVYAAAVCGILCFGIFHLNRMNALENEKTDTVRIASVTCPYCGTFSEAAYVNFTWEETIETFTKAVNDAALENAEILVFSEEAYSVRDVQEQALINKAKKLAFENNMHLLLAYEVEDSDNSEDGKAINKLCWISNEGEILCDYIKHCIIPVIETTGYVRGENNIAAFDVIVHGKNLKVATAICYDADFELFMSHMEKGTDLLLIPTWDWKVIAEEHFGIARLRAISSGTTLVRSVYDGWNAVIDSAGNVLMRANTNDTGYGTVLVYDVPVK